MNRGQFSANVNDAWNLIRTLKLDEIRIYNPNYSSLTSARFRTKSYTDIWRDCFSNRHFDFLLEDMSMIQFCHGGNSNLERLRLNYSFYECPFSVSSYSDFLKEEGFEYHEVGEQLREEYDLYLNDAPEKKAITPIRYDYDPESYDEGCHPASHVHFGHRSSIRLASKNILTPISFVLFIVRQCYPKQWKEYLLASIPPPILGNVRSSLTQVPRRFWNSNDDAQMILQ